MRKFLRFFCMAVILLCANISVHAVSITKSGGWFEAAYVEWTPEADASYEVFVAEAGTENWTKLDKELLRKYNGYMRADAVGLKAGNYQLKVVSSVSGEAKASALVVNPHDRSGFAHVGMSGGIGAYKNDGTLKDNAKVLYVWADNAKTVSTVVKIGSKNTNVQTYTGLQDIITAYQKGYDTTPLAIRIIGTIKAADMDRFDSKEEGLQVKGKDAYREMPITIEGIGEDAAISGFGILIRNCKSTEFRNFAIMLCKDDCLSLDTDNSNIWIHNMDFFYGNTGGDADQSKGDGTVDIKTASKNVTVSYNHFYDSGKCSLGGMSGEIPEAWHTYHHNWFDHSDSRHPRIRVQFFHVYNNYYDGISKYGIGAAMGGTAFVENNYFRNCKYPMLSSKQGTDAEGDGTFSGENGGVIKAYNNVIINEKKIMYYDGSQTDGKWDAVLVNDRTASVSATAFSGGTPYNNDADVAARTTYIENNMDAPEDVPAKVKQYAGRMNGGDITWTFNNSVQDENDKVITDLKDMIVNYQSTLVGFADGKTISNGGATERVDAGDGKGIDPAVNDAYKPSWVSGGGGTITPPDASNYIIGSAEEYFWFNNDNKDAVNAYIANGTISGGNFQPTQEIKSSGGDVYSDYIGSIRVAQNGALTFYNENGIAKLDAYVSANGTMKWQLATSNDGESFTNYGSAIEGIKGTHPSVVYSGEAVKYVRITNLGSGNRDVQGVKIAQPGTPAPDTRAESDLAVNEDSKTINIGDTYTITHTSSSTGAISYTSNNSAVATVNSNGVVTAIKEGTATITVTQAADDSYKNGQKTVTITVVDSRAASTFALTSDNTLSLGVEGTSQIETQNAAGAVTYTSSNTSVATVSETGLITAVDGGSAVITVTDAGSATVKGGSVTVTVNVIKEVSEEVVCHFTGNKPSSSMVSVVTGNYSDSKGSVTFGGETYSNCVKIESATNITITPSFACKVTLVFDLAGKKLKIDGESKTTDSNKEYSFDATTAVTTYTLTKGDSMNIFLIIFKPNTSGINDVQLTEGTDSGIYDLQGRRVVAPQKGMLYISNGKKVIMK